MRSLTGVLSQDGATARFAYRSTFTRFSPPLGVLAIRRADGAARRVLLFDEPARPHGASSLGVAESGGWLYFTLSDPQSDIWVATVTGLKRQWSGSPPFGWTAVAGSARGIRARAAYSVNQTPDVTFTRMIERALSTRIRDRLRAMPAVVLLGPRQVGKTTLARAIARERGDRALYLDLEREADRRRLDDADAYLRAQAGKLVILDEIHRLPGLFERLRGIIDDRRAAGEKAGHFLLLGSASLELQHQAGESLAGRVAYLELTPVLAHELPLRGLTAERLWVRGGFPGSLLARSGAESLEWRLDFVRSYLERDVPMFAPRLPTAMVGRLWGMLAHAHATPLNKARLAASLEVSAPAVGRYVDLLADLLLVRRLPPWSGNIGKRLVRAPKVYLRDSGLLHALLGLGSLDEVLSHPVAGASWEGFVLEQLIAAAGSERVAMYFRTEKGAEADLVLERGGRVDAVVEIKRSSAPVVSKGFRIACEDLSPRAAYVVHGGDASWPMGDGVTAVSLPELVKRLGQR